eukprot:COSAG02_NODE_6395_length_3600_cov_4.516710_4_plen_88_part_00
MRLVTENILKEFEKAVAQREIEIAESAQVRADAPQPFLNQCANCPIQYVSLRVWLAGGAAPDGGYVGEDNAPQQQRAFRTAQSACPG